MNIQRVASVFTLALAILGVNGCGQRDTQPIEPGEEVAPPAEQGSAEGYAVTVGDSPQGSALPDGHEPADFVEVAPGVHLLRDLVESGEIEFIPEGEQVHARALPDLSEQINAPPTPLPPGEGCPLVWSTYCSDYRSASAGGNWSIGGNSFSWSDSIWASSSSQYGCHSQSSASVSYSVCSNAAYPPSWMDVYAYIYINGSYVGNVSRSGSSTSMCMSGSFSTWCSGGVVRGELRPVGHDFQQSGSYLAAGTNLTVTARCDTYCSSSYTCCYGVPEE